ncbi:MAG: translocation/assembly module TamB domain-containing protein [Opitutus sp.]
MRRFLVISSIVVLALAVLVLSVPWWMGEALRQFGPKFGVTFTRYERVGYSRFALEGVEVRHDPVVVTVTRAEADTPVLWLWRRWLSKPGRVVGGEWTTVVSASNKTQAPSKSDSGWVPLQKTLHRVADYLALWVPEVEAGRGVVSWPGQEITFASVTWKDRTIACPDAGYRILHASVRAAFSAQGLLDANIATLDGAGSAVIRSEGASVRASAKWWEQPAEFVANFEPRGWLPHTADVRASQWELPAARLKLGSNYSVARGGGVIEWKEGQLRLNLSASAQPVEHTPAPPLAVEVHGHAADGAFVAEALQVNLPGIDAHLTAPVAIDRGARLRSAPSNFTFNIDLAGQPWFPASGRLQGTGQIGANAEQQVRIDFSASGDDVSVAETAIKRASTSGALDWPRVNLKEGVVVGADGSELKFSGGWDILTREIVNASVRGRVARALFSRWLPEYPKFDAIDVDVTAAGPWATAKHEGRAHAVDVTFPRMRPVALTLEWKGTGTTVDHFDLGSSAGSAAIAAAGTADRTHLTLRALTISEGDATRLELTAPAEMTWGSGVQLSSLDLSGPEARLEAAMTWRADGQARVRLQHFRSEWLRPWLVLPSTNGTVDLLEADAHWANGPATFTVNAGVTVELGNNRAAQVAAQLSGAGEGIEINSLRVAEGGAVIVTANGRVPIAVRPTGTPRWEILERAPFSFDATSAPNPSFWEKITQLTGVEIVQPEIAVHVGGSLREPKGEARLSAAHIAPLDGKAKAQWPKVGMLNLHALGDQNGVSVEQFSVAIEGQTVRASGRLPIDVNTWRDLRADPGELVRRSEIHLEVPDAEIAAFVHYFPEYIAPKGRFQLDLKFQGEKSVTGFIRLNGATSRPLGPLGVLQEINADIQFRERIAHLQAVTARMGGQLVTLQGTAELKAGQQPALDLTLKGENLPFVRRAGLLVRGDLDLKLATENRPTPLISGVVRLRDSLFFADIRSLLPSGTKGVAGRPPYFSIETRPLNTWGIDVQVLGEKFMRLRTPVFNGTATAHFRLDGTLGEPRLAGEAAVDQGTIRLPFSSFAVQQGEVRFSAGEVEPQLFVTSTARRYGYDLRMELTGATSSPKLTFSSSPPLEAEQLLLMVMAGEAPHNEVSTTDRQRVARVGAFFGQTLLGSLGGDPTGADRLTISSGTDISEQGRETYNIEYKLSNRWALTGEYDEFDDYYGGLKWRIYPKKEPGRDEKK